MSFALGQADRERVREAGEKEHLKGCWLKGHRVRRAAA